MFGFPFPVLKRSCPPSLCFLPSLCLSVLNLFLRLLPSDKHHVLKFLIHQVICHFISFFQISSPSPQRCFEELCRTFLMNFLVKKHQIFNEALTEMLQHGKMMWEDKHMGRSKHAPFQQHTWINPTTPLFQQCFHDLSLSPAFTD